MSYGSISQEAHENLAIAMNRLGGKSNTGEGGEDSDRFTPDENGDLRRSAVKQVASGRFGVTSEYLVNADDLQIKMAQGAKPGEGGQLPGQKVYPWIARTRHSTPGVGLISPPPHHDIYSIEDLAQLIHDLKNANDRARVHVKLVAEVGVGTVAAGVSKAHADVVLISGHDGGTGAAPLTSLKHAGTPWELGLAETQQTLLLNGLRDRIVVQTDGQLKTGRDVVIAALLGAEEYGFATAPLVVSGCIMMRVCHLDTCPVGVATQNPELRKKFSGKPEFVETFFTYIAEEVREHLAALGFRSLDEAIGQAEVLDTSRAVEHWKAHGLDLAPILHVPDLPEGTPRRRTTVQDHGLVKALDNELITRAADALQQGQPVQFEVPVRNVNRTVGTMLGAEVTRRYGGAGLPDGTIDITLTGSAGQSFGAFLPRGITLRLVGDANDYLGKGLSGGRLSRPPGADRVVGGGAERDRRQRPALRGNGRRGVRPRTGGGAVRGPQLRRHGGRGGSRRPRLRVHDRRPGRRPRSGGAQLRGRHVRRDGVRAGPARRAGQRRDGRPGGAGRRGPGRAARPRPAARRAHRLGRRRRAARGLGRERRAVHQGDAARLQERAAGPGEVARGRLRARTARRPWTRSWRHPVADPKGFLTTPQRELPTRRPVDVRIMDWNEVYEPAGRRPAAKRQAGRCMDCGIPFCHDGCPLGNLIPEWNDLAWRDDWQAAIERLHATNNFPEFTGRLCPAPCEGSCVLGINSDPVTIKQVEVSIIDRAWDEGWVQPQPPERLTGRTVAVVGSGPAGLAAAQQLTRAGHTVVVLERADAVGGLLRYGIPEFKMEKRQLDRRVEQMRAEGTRFSTGVDVGGDITRGRAAGEVRRGGAGARRDGRAGPAGARPRARRGAAGDGVPAARQPGGARPGVRGAGVAPRASTSSSSAAATPAPTAWARRTGREPRRSPSSRSCRGRPTSGRAPTPGPPGR